MTKEVVMGRLQEVFRDAFGDEELILGEEMKAGDVEEWDSLMQITLLEAIQGEFGIRFSFDEMLVLDSVGKIVKTIINKG